MSSRWVYLRRMMLKPLQEGWSSRLSVEVYNIFILLESSGGDVEVELRRKNKDATEGPAAEGGVGMKK